MNIVNSLVEERKTMKEQNYIWEGEQMGWCYVVKYEAHKHGARVELNNGSIVNTIDCSGEYLRSYNYWKNSNKEEMMGIDWVSKNAKFIDFSQAAIDKSNEPDTEPKSDTDYDTEDLPTDSEDEEGITTKGEKERICYDCNRHFIEDEDNYKEGWVSTKCFEGEGCRTAIDN